MTAILGNGAVQGGLGGAAGFGETALPRADDGIFTVDLSMVFEHGFSIAGAIYRADAVQVATDGFVSFGPAQGDLPDVTQLTNPFIAAFLADVDTRLDGEGAESGPIWLDIDPIRDVVTITWADVGFYRRNAELTNRFQIQLYDQGVQGVDVVLRYDRIDWTSGDLQGGWGGLGGDAPWVGYRLGAEITPLTTTEARLLPTHLGNTGVAGLWVLHLPAAGPDLAQDGDDTLIGGIGADRLDGGKGFDWVSYASATAGLYISLTTPGLNTGAAAGDVFVSIEGILGSAFDDTLQGAALDGGAGADLVLGTDGADHLWGGLGDDTLSGGSGADIIFGGAGFDWLRFQTAVVLDLVDSAANTGDAAGDICDSIEAVQGSAEADTVSGDASANLLAGGGGDDLIQGRAGDDHLVGDAGNDTLDGGAGQDALWGGAGQDWVSYRHATAGLRIDLADPRTNTGEAAGDSYAQIDGVLGSDFADTILGSAAPEVLEGGAGDDLMAGDESDILYGGTGLDTVSFALADSRQIIDMTAARLGAGQTTDARFASIEAVIGSEFGDLIWGADSATSLQGGGGNDGLVGKGAGDHLSGGTGDDRLFGGAGDDVLDGGAGDDLLAGGAGADQFRQSGGTDWITDFTPGSGDLLIFDGALFGIGDFMVSQDSRSRLHETAQDVLVITYMPSGQDLWILNDPNQHITQVSIQIDGILYDLI